MNALYFATVTGEFASKLKGMLWTAYGPVIKTMFWIVLIICVGGPLLAFIRRLFR